MQEEWRDIAGYEGLYQVSDIGRVRSLGTSRTDGKHFPSKILKQNFKTRGGYATVNLHKDKKQKSHKVHRLVAINFIGITSSEFDVDHIDGNRANNLLSNLRYASKSDNSRNVHRVKSKTGKVGVFYSNDPMKPTYRVYVCVKYKMKFLGYFNDINAACAARQNYLDSLVRDVVPMKEQ